MDEAQLAPYLEAGADLIPLHRPDHVDGKGRRRGKSPSDPGWTTADYSRFDARAHMGGGANVGVRLGAADLVVDVDPRAFADGDDPWARMCADVGLDPDDYPTVETGSGGLHVYMRKPADVSVRDSLSDYRGVEFKTLGRQVVAAGSVHPDTGRAYEWDALSPGLSDAPEAPRLLVDLARRPRTAAATGGGEHSQAELAEMLDRLDPEDFRDHDGWLTLMQACHHATAGDGRAEFVEWSTRDPEYADDAAIIGRRWDSLHADTEGARVTHRTLHKLLRDAGAADAVPRARAEDDFEEVGPGESQADVPEHERKGPMERMNDRYWAVMEGGQFRIYWRQVDPSQDPPLEHWVRAKPYDFGKYLANERVERGDKTVPKADAWIEWPGRRSAEGVVFDPEREHPRFLNLWTGWAVEPRRRPGGWSRLQELLEDVLCDGDSRVVDYVMNWAAYMAQRPGHPAEVAICFQGQKGVGKGTWGRALAGLCGRHGMQITSSEHLVGRFNDHLRDKILLFADEAIKPYDKDGESRLKGLITEPTLAFEGKGRDVQADRNRLHVVMASNEDWFVPMGLDGERRFLLQRANRSWQGRTSRFEALHRQLRDGGLSALLWDLLERDIEGWAPRSSIPVTAASREQKVRNMKPVAQWWFNCLTEGEPPCDPVSGPGWGEDWALDPVRLLRQQVRESFEEHCRRNGVRHSGGMSRSVDMTFASEIEALVPSLGKTKVTVPHDIDGAVRTHGDGRAWAYALPSLGECRDRMEELLGGPVNWDEATVAGVGREAA